MHPKIIGRKINSSARTRATSVMIQLYYRESILGLRRHKQAYKKQYFITGLKPESSTHSHPHYITTIRYVGLDSLGKYGSCWLPRNEWNSLSFVYQCHLLHPLIFLLDFFFMSFAICEVFINGSTIYSQTKLPQQMYWFFAWENNLTQDLQTGLTWTTTSSVAVEKTFEDSWCVSKQWCIMLLKTQITANTLLWPQMNKVRLFHLQM